jgi:hypothetical protein
VHRLGQKKEVFIERLVISDTVEQRVQEIQARKQGLSDGALGEGTGQRMRLSVGELAHREYENSLYFILLTQSASLRPWPSSSLSKLTLESTKSSLSSLSPALTTTRYLDLTDFSFFC